MPYRDAAGTLDEALASVLAEGAPDFELIAIDDGSRDESARVVASWAQRDERVVCVRGVGGGIAEALTRGLAHSEAPYLARMDADDICLPGRFADTLAALEASPRLAAVGTRVEAFPEAAVQEGLRLFVEWQNGLLTPEDHRRELFIDAPLCNPSVTFTREAFERVGGYRDDGLAEDYSLWLRLDEAGYELAKLPGVLLKWRQQEGRATFTQPHFSREAMRELKAGFLARRCLADGRPVSIWGAGRDGRRTARALEAHGLTPKRFIDIDPKKVGREARGVPIEAPDMLEAGDLVIASVAARGARAAIRAHLTSHGLREGDDFFCTA